MQITLTDGRTELFQWDTGVQIQVDGQCNQFHFANKLLGRSIDVDAEQGEGISSCKIPDVLLQVSQPLKVYVFIRTITGGITKLEQDFTVKGRNKPNDYVFTPAEQLTLEEIKAIAQGAEKTANSVRADADAGKFHGEKGEPGDVYIPLFKVIKNRLIMLSNPGKDKIMFTRRKSRLFYKFTEGGNV